MIVGRLGAGKTVYLRRLRSFQAQQESVYADQPQQDPPSTETIVKACQWFPEQFLTEKWMQIWKRAVLNSLATHILAHHDLRRYVSQEQAESIRYEYGFLLGEFRRPRSIYAELTDIVNGRHSGRQLTAYLDDPAWEDLEDVLAEILRTCPPIFFYLDAVDEEFSHAPMYWLLCQKGLFYQVMRFLRDPRLGGRLHIVISIRDIVMSSVYRSEHAPRYQDEPHIRVLGWTRKSIEYLLPRSSSGSTRRSSWAPTTVPARSRPGLGPAGPQPGPGRPREGHRLPAPAHPADPPRHSLPRQRHLRRDRASEGGRPAGAIPGRPATGGVALLQAVRRLPARPGQQPDRRGHDAEGRRPPRLHRGLHQHRGVPGRDRPAAPRDHQMRRRRPLHAAGARRHAGPGSRAFDSTTNLPSVLWQSGLLGYVEQDGEAHFYSQADMDQFDIPMDADHYVFHPNMIDSVRIRGIGTPSIRSAAAEADHSNEGYQVGARACYQCGHLGVALQAVRQSWL